MRRITKSSRLTSTPRGDRCADWPVEVDPIYGCEIWRGKRSTDGYPELWVGGRNRRAYYIAWERARGPVPQGKELDHTCRRTLCVAVAHLEVVSRSENERRKQWARTSKRAICAAGHDLWLHGRRTPQAGIVCLICSGLK